MEGLELTCFQIISAVGAARSLFIEAIQLAKKADFEGARKLISEGEEMFTQGHHAHMELVTKEARQEEVKISLLLLHAEDQLMSAEGFKIIANEFIDVYETLGA
ncbi:MAG: PTS lactose/cellobiose transporter subunit IIA [Erysipelotrichaceae bacterium]